MLRSGLEPRLRKVSLNNRSVDLLDHAGEVASMALRLLEEVGAFTIAHRPGQGMRIRIGMHR